MFEILETKERIIENNDEVAKKVKEYTTSKNVFLVNLMASPGSGKTTLLERTIEALKDEYRIGVMEADVDSDVDAKRIEKAGAKVIQLHSGGLCHMDADMTFRGIEALGVEDVDILFLENIGNLVCPAEFDVGADLKVMILSVPEGDDKPLKYPLMFTISDVMLVNKIDTLPVFDFDFEKAKERALKLNPKMEFVQISALKGEGIDEWIELLKRKVKEKL